MNLTSTSKLPGRTLGNLAFAGSLFLHIGLIVFFSPWQWDWKVADKNPPETIQVKFLPTPTLSQSTETPNFPKPIPRIPSEPISTQPNSKSHLIPRNPNLSAPILPPVRMTHQMTRSHSKTTKSPLAQPASLANTQLFPATTPISTRAADQPMVTRHRFPIRQTPVSGTPVALSQTPFPMKKPKSETNRIHPLASPVQFHPDTPSPLAQPTSLASTQLFHATTPISTRAADQPMVTQHRFPVRQTRFSGTPVTLSQNAFPMKKPESEANRIHPLTVPVQFRPDTLSSIDGAVAQVPKQFAHPKTSEIHLAALPRKFSPATQHELESNLINLSNLRGLFTGKVRQRIANTKYYPKIAKRRGMEGLSVIAFTLDKNGRLMKAGLAQTSGYQPLDQAALEAVHLAAPYPEIPTELKTNTFQFKLPISFVLK